MSNYNKRGKSMKRTDLKMVVSPFFENIKNYDETLHGDISDFFIDNYKNCLTKRGEYVSYDFLPDGIPPEEVKKTEEMLIVGNALKIASIELEEFNEKDFNKILLKIKSLAKEKGWKTTDLNVAILEMFGFKARKIEVPDYFVRPNFGKDYN